MSTKKTYRVHAHLMVHHRGYVEFNANSAKEAIELVSSGELDWGWKESGENNTFEIECVDVVGASFAFNNKVSIRMKDECRED